MENVFHILTSLKPNVKNNYWNDILDSVTQS